MIDLNALLGAALQQAVETATAPLVARIDELEQAHQVLVLRINATLAAEQAAEPLTRDNVADLVRDRIEAGMVAIEENLDDKIASAIADLDLDDMVSRAIADLDLSDQLRGAVRDLLDGARIEID